MPITLICPNLRCGQTVVAPDGARGKVVRCAHCQTLFMVPKDRSKTSGSESTPSGGGQNKKQ